MALFIHNLNSISHKHVNLSSNYSSSSKHSYLSIIYSISELPSKIIYDNISIHSYPQYSITIMNTIYSITHLSSISIPIYIQANLSLSSPSSTIKSNPQNITHSLSSTLNSKHHSLLVIHYYLSHSNIHLKSLQIIYHSNTVHLYF